MFIGVPKEIKNHEYRVGLTPSSVKELTNHGHTVYIETKAGEGIGFFDTDYEAVGAQILPTANDIFEKSDMIVKVKEPLASEYGLIRENQILFTFLHLAPDPEQTQGLLKSGCVGIAYETVTDDHGRLPLLAPMSEVAGRMSVQVGAQLLEKSKGGSGVLLSGVCGVAPGKVLVLGGGVVGANAARIAAGMGAEVTILDKNPQRLNELDWMFRGQAKVLYSNADTLHKSLKEADCVIGAVLVPGASAPKVITRTHLKDMKAGSVLIDVAIDQGGCFETSIPTSHENPTFVEAGVVHYCVTNMPGAVARTSSIALNNATLPFVLNLANKGYKKALSDNHHLKNGLNVCHGHVTHPAVAEALNLSFKNPNDFIS